MQNSHIGAKPFLASSTPIKLPGTHTTPNKLDNKFLNSSFTSNSFCDDRNDLTFEVDMDCDSSDNDSTHTDDSTEFIEGDTQTLIANQGKSIRDLFARLKCRECDCTVDMSDTAKDFIWNNP